MQTMYPGIVNSPVTELAAAIDDAQTSIDVLDGVALPDAPNLAVIGQGSGAETILYTSKASNTLSGVTRGFQGVAVSHQQGTKVARNFTEHDYAALVANINELESSKETPSGAQAKADAAQAAAEQDATNKANQAETNAINFAKSFGVGSAAKDISGQSWGRGRESGFYMGLDMTDKPPYTTTPHPWEYGIYTKHNDTYALLTVTDFNNTETWQRVISGGPSPWKMITDSGGFQGLKQSVSSGKQLLANTIGYVTAASTFQQMADEIHLSKRDQAIALNAKNITADENEPLHDLTLKTAQIQVGKPYASGTITATSNNITVPLPFTPKFVKLFVSGSSDYMRVSSEMNVYTVRWGTSSWSQVFELGHAGGSFYLEPNQFRFTYPTNSYTFNNGNNISYEAWG